MENIEFFDEIKTTQGTLEYRRDWDNYDGGIVMKNAKTVKRYKEIKASHPDCDECGVFFAFSDKSFNNGYKRLIGLGHIKDGDKVCAGGNGMYGTRDGIRKFHSFYDGLEGRIKQECDPQEVYFHEYNNHESMVSWDGDTEAIKIIIRIWGADTARHIKRFNDAKTVDSILHKAVKVRLSIPSGRVYFTEDGHCWEDGTGKPVLDQDRRQYVNTELSGLSASYDSEEGVLYNYDKI